MSANARINFEITWEVPRFLFQPLTTAFVARVSSSAAAGCNPQMRYPPARMKVASWKPV
jgi:hypothetical protein